MCSSRIKFNYNIYYNYSYRFEQHRRRNECYRKHIQKAYLGAAVKMPMSQFPSKVHVMYITTRTTRSKKSLLIKKIRIVTG